MFSLSPNGKEYLRMRRNSQCSVCFIQFILLKCACLSRMKFDVNVERTDEKQDSFMTS
jgi:hypothetical protein